MKSGREVGDMKERRIGRLLMWDLEERRSLPRVLRFESVVCFCFLRFLERIVAMDCVDYLLSDFSALIEENPKAKVLVFSG